jgi:hypothetical protein
MGAGLGKGSLQEALEKHMGRDSDDDSDTKDEGEE